MRRCEVVSDLNKDLVRHHLPLSFPVQLTRAGEVAL